MIKEKKQYKQKDLDSVRNLLRFWGDDPDREGLKNTPRRVLSSREEMFAGLKIDEKKFLASIKTMFTSNYDQLITLVNIPVVSVCEHHILPFIGNACIGYIPKLNDNGESQVIGLSKIPKLVKYYASRPQIQEQLTKQIASALEGIVDPLGVGVMISAEHTCMTLRGIQARGTYTVTTDLRGVFRDDEKARSEFLTIANNANQTRCF